jgi:hypothetical protein
MSTCTVSSDWKVKSFYVNSLKIFLDLPVTGGCRGYVKGRRRFTARPGIRLSPEALNQGGIYHG